MPHYPLKSNGFTFKRFFVAHDKCPMKVTTDSVLLAIWVSLADDCQRILDIGTGCGVIALILAQRTENYFPPILIDGIEIDQQAAQQSDDNRQQSPWETRLTIIHQDILLYTQQTSYRYDLIVSNPPYFKPGSDCRNQERGQGRYTITLSHLQLLDSAGHLLSKKGRLCLVLPFLQARQFQQYAIQSGWFLGQVLDIQHTIDKQPTLTLFEMALHPLAQQASSLVLRDETGQYTDEFYLLAKDFQLFLNKSSK